MTLAGIPASRRGALCFFTLIILSGGCGRSSKSGASDPPASATDRMGAADPSDPLAAARVPDANANVLTFHHNNARTGEYLSETLLTPSNVNSERFGKIGFLRVRGLVDAQPLYVKSLVVQG